MPNSAVFPPSCLATIKQAIISPPTTKKWKKVRAIFPPSKPKTIFKSELLETSKILSTKSLFMNFVTSININKKAGAKNDWFIRYFHHIWEYFPILGRIIPKKANGEKIITIHK